MRALPLPVLVLGSAIALLTALAPTAIATVDPVVAGQPLIEGDRLAVNHLHVTVATPATGAVTMRLSNDMTTWTEMAWAASVEWDLDAADLGGNSYPGLRRVSVWFDNGTGTWDPDWQGSDIIWYDLQPPVETSLQVSLWPGRTVGTSGSVPVRVTYLNKDNVGTQWYDADDRIDGAASWTPISVHVPLGGIQPSLASGHTHQLRVRGIDYAGNLGNWLVGPSIRLTAYQESSPKITWTGSWSRITGAALWGGASRSTTVAGATATLTFTGRMVGVVLRTGPKRGIYSVYLDGVRVGAVDMIASSLSPRRVVFTKSWPTAGRHTIRIKLQSVLHRTRGELDAFIVGS